MRQYSTLILTLIMAINCNDFSQATDFADENYTKDNYETVSSSISHNTSNQPYAAVVENRKNTRYQHNYKWNFHNPSKNLATQENTINLRPYLEKPLSYSPSIYSKVDCNNANNMAQQQLQQHHKSLNNLPYHNLQDIYDGKTLKSQHLLSSPHQELSRDKKNLIYDPYQLINKPKHPTIRSDDHLKTRYLAAYVTPSPSSLEMHPNFHQHIPMVIYKNPTIMSHATGNEPSPVTTESIKSLTTITNIPHVLATAGDEKLIVNNKLRHYDNGAKQVSPAAGSKQFMYAPSRSSLEKELSYSSNLLPYPPSFISFTTTEKPLLSYESVNNKVPDFFTQRRYKSLWDSYIPSWQITKMLQQIKNKNNIFNNKQLLTLAFVKHNNKKIEK